MAHPYHHSLSSVKKWGGEVADYQPIRDWFDGSKKIIADFQPLATDWMRGITSKTIGVEAIDRKKRSPWLSAKSARARSFAFASAR